MGNKKIGKEKIIELIKCINSLDDIKEVLLATKEYYKVMNKREYNHKRKMEHPIVYKSNKTTEYDVEYKIGDGEVQKKKFRSLKDIGEEFGMLAGKVSYCVYKKRPVEGKDCKIVSINKINKV